MESLLFDARERALQKTAETDLGIRIGSKLNVWAFADDITILTGWLEDVATLTRIFIDGTGTTKTEDKLY